MTEASEFLAWLAGALGEAEIPYMVTGSLGSALHGMQRATNDVDVVIDPTESQLGAFLDSLGDEFYASRPAAREALRHRGMFNVIHTPTGQKVDLILRKDRPFSVQEFARRVTATLEGTEICAVTPEDAILSKLEWSQAGQSERQFRDALGVAVVQGKTLDVAYLREWGEKLGVAKLLDDLLYQASKNQGSG